MPIVLKEQIGQATLVVWRITESEQELEQLATPADVASADRFTSSKRRAEHLAWRIALREIIPTAEISYNAVGAPIIVGESHHIGVSHTDDVVLLLITNSHCAVDVESATRDFSNARGRYISAFEMTLPDVSHPHFDAAVWCAKEALYKYSGCKELSLIDDIQVVSSDLESGRLTANLCSQQSVDVKIVVWEEYIIAVIAD